MGESFFSGYERNILPRGAGEYKTEKDFKMNVLIGNLGSREQYQYMKDNHQQPYYHITCCQLRLDKYNLEYLALYQRANLFEEQVGIRHLWKIRRVEVKKNIPVGNKKYNLKEIVHHPRGVFKNLFSPKPF